MVTDYPLTIRHADGALTDVLYNASVYRDEAATCWAFLPPPATLRRKSRASQYARSLIEASLDPLVTISADGTITT